MRSCDNGKDRNDTEEQSACKSDLVKNLLDIVGGGSTLSDTGYSTALLLKIVGNLYGIEGDLSIELCKSNDKSE